MIIKDFKKKCVKGSCTTPCWIRNNMLFPNTAKEKIVNETPVSIRQEEKEFLNDCFYTVLTTHMFIFMNIQRTHAANEGGVSETASHPGQALTAYTSSVLCSWVPQQFS